ncbi:hypothetical protein ACCO45_008690 [Purpureocillium lilacinum]|uniref:Uncharacterized protein n=1 Tax=Purpureocillium lilacinum TaxID=33203 RepID=A0ACC4DQG8_PURLI
MHLAYCELYITIAALALRVWPRMSLYDSTIADIELALMAGATRDISLAILDNVGLSMSVWRSVGMMC